MKKVKVFLAVLLAAALLLPAPVRAEMEYRFSDKNTIFSEFSWGQEDIVEAIDFELYYGYPDGTLRLGNSITRAEFPAVLARCLDVSGTRAPAGTTLR